MRLKWYLWVVFTLLFSGFVNAQNTLDKIGLSSSTPASVAYSLRLLSSSYTGPLVRVKVGTSFYDVYPDAASNKFSLSSKISASISTYNASVAVASINTLSSIITGSTNATVAVWYDQSGSSVNVFSSSTTAKIITSGSINTLNGQPTIYFNGSSSSLVSTATVNYSSQTNATVNAVVQDVGSIDYISGIISTGNNGGWGLNYDPTSTIKGYWIDASGSWGANSNENYTVPKIVTGLIGTTTNSSLYINSQLKTTRAAQPISNGTADLINIGVRGNASNRIFIGNISETFIFPKNLSSSEQSALESSQSIYILPAVSITSSSSGTIASGTTVTFTATPLNYNTPAYQWYKNEIAISGATGNVYTTGSLINNDLIYVTVKDLSPPAGGSITTSGLIVQLDASDPTSYTSGNTWTDLKGNANGAINGAVSYTSNSTASYFSFPGANSAYIKTSGSQAIKDFTIIFQPDFSAINYSGGHTLFAKGTNDDHSLRFWSYNFSGYSNPNAPVWGVPNQNSNGMNDWAGTNSLFLNGVNQTSNFPALVYGWNILGGTNNTTASWGNFAYYLGAPSSGTAGNRPFQGKMAVVLFYNRTLTSAEQVQNFNALRSRFELASNAIITTVATNNSITLTSATGTNSQTTCANTAISSISYSTTGATGATFSGLPTGVTGSWSNNVVTISGTPTVSGTNTYTVTLTGGYGSISASGSILVKATNALALTSAAGTNSQTICINTAINSLTYSTTGATGATFSGLPAGVTGTWSSNVVTISGTPTVTGTYSYTITLTGGCGTISATGTIAVNPINTIALSSAAGTDAQTLCSTAALINITYNTTGATGASFSGLPTGVSGAWSNNVVTISGTPTTAGNYTYTVTLTGGCGTVTAAGNITVTSMTVSISSSAAGNTICNGDLVTFTAVVQNSCLTPAYQWYKNGTAISGANSATYSSTSISNNDLIYVTATPGSNSGGISTASLIANFDAANYDASSTRWTDLSTSANHMDFYTSVGYSTLKTATYSTDGGGSLILNNNSVFGKTISNTGISGNGGKTMSVWVKFDNDYKQFESIAGLGIYDYPKLFEIYTYNDGAGRYFYNHNSGIQTGSVTRIPFNGWYHLTISSDGTSNKVYINGVLDRFDNYALNTTNTPLYLGYSSATASWSDNLGGKIATLSLYNTALSTQTILDNYNATKDRFTATSISSNTITNTVTSIVLSSAAGTNAQTVCINTAINNLTYSTTGATGATFAGLPAGVSGSWSNNVVTISGTPTETGTFSYTVTLTGGCTGNITASGTITVNPTNEISLTSIAASTSQTLCINTALSSITYSSTSATGATYSGLPAGVNGSYSNGVVTISGTPTTSGTFNYTVLLTGGCGNVTATGTIIVTPNNTITLTSAAGTDNAQTPCLNSAITAITYTTVRATDATVLGLPAGVTGVWSNNVFTISGTPTESGTFNYTITLVGGCGIVTKSGTIIVRPNNTITLTSATATSAQTLCNNNSAITNINYATTTATGASFSGFPAGVVTSWSGNVVTISGTPTTAGTYTYTVTTSGGCSNASLTGTINVRSLPVIQLSVVGDGCSDKTSLIATTGLTTYAWYKDNTVVNGAASGTYTPSLSGVYKVQVSDGICSNTSTTTTISTCGLTAEGKTMPTATSTTLVSIEGATNNGTGVNVAGKILDITVTNSINIIEAPANGGALVLNLDARNLNSLSHSANPGTWYDLSGNDNDATVYGSLAFGTGNGGAMNFPGGNANYAQAKDGVYFTGSSFTIQSWVYPIQVLNWNRIIDFGNGAGRNNILLSNSYGTSGAPGLYIEGTQFQATRTLTLNAWHFVCATYNLATRIAIIYIDGQPSGTGSMPPPVNVVRTYNYIGRSNWGFGDPNFNGGIGSIQIYNGYLTAAEILSNYESTKGLYGIQ